MVQKFLEKREYNSEIRTNGKQPEFFYGLDAEKYLKKLISPNVVLILVMVFAGIYFVGIISRNTVTAGFIGALLVLIPVLSFGAPETALAELILR